MSHLKEFLDNYTSLNGPGYVVLVTGAWGTGKTYQVQECIPEDERCYVSLYGVQTVEQPLSDVVVANALSMARTKMMPNSGCVRLTDVSVVGESPTERKGSHHFHREPCACHREVSGEASVAACAGQAIEPRNRLCRMRRDFPGNRRQHFSAAFG